MRTLFFIVLVASPCFAGGPNFGPKYDSERTNLEFQNAYHDIQNVPNGRYLTSSMTLQGLTVDSATVNAVLNMTSHKIINLANGTASSDAVAFGQLSGVRVVQIISSTTLTSFSTGNGSPTSAQVASITPTSSSSKIIVIACGSLTSNSSAQAAFATLFNGSTNLAGSTVNYFAANTAGQNDQLKTMVYVDSPGSTSQQTYVVKVWGDGSHQSGWGINSSGILSIILIEIG